MEHSTSEHENHVHHKHHNHSTEGTTKRVVSWAESRNATLHCLTGCAIGEVLGMVIGTALGFSDIATVILAITLAFMFGYALTMRAVLKAGVGFTAALSVAFAADTVSITIMEIVDNAIMLAIPGAMDAGVTGWIFWASLAFALFVAFLVAWPVNRYLIGRGLGHAKVHQYHEGHHAH